MPARLRKLHLTSGATIEVSDHLTVVVGPNNVGKSVLLSSVWQQLNQGFGQAAAVSPVVANVELQGPTLREVDQRLRAIGEVRPMGQYPQGYAGEDHYFSPQIGMVPVSQLTAQLQQGVHEHRLGWLAGQVGAFLPPEARLGQLGNVGVPNLYGETPTAPLQKLWADRRLEAEVQVLAKRAFDIDLTVNRHGGSQIGLHVGRPTSPEPAVGELSPYLQEVARLPTAAAQGHGVQAFLGMLLALTSGAYDFVLIDEPEAFLHPPQARLLGEIFVEFAKKEVQVLVSTHSDDFLRGVLTASAASTEVTVVRLTRPSAMSNAVAQLDPAAARGLFEDPLLRYSNILGGIFYKGVVLCEAEGDCQYFSAVLDQDFADAEAALPRPDLLFTQCGGKDRFAKAAAALLSTEVPTAVIADIDLLADRVKFEELLSVLGGDPTQLGSALNAVQAAVSARAAAPQLDFFKFRADEILARASGPTLSSAEVKELRALLKSQTGWELAKSMGRAVLPAGQAVDAFDRISSSCREVGLFILPVGELERFHPEVGGNKQAWLRQVFERELFASPPVEAADLLRDVVAYIGTRQIRVDGSRGPASG